LINYFLGEVERSYLFDLSGLKMLKSDLGIMAG